MDRPAFGANESIVDWYMAIPVITRYYMTAIVSLAILCWWRLITPFLYFGPVNFDFLFHMFFLMRYCRVLEEEAYYNKPADFLFMLLFGAFFMLLVGPILKANFLSTSLTFMIVYVWSRRNPQVMMNFLGVFNFTAPFMPWVLLGFSLLLSGQLPVADLIGIAAGHLYYYWHDVFPAIYGYTPLETPHFLKVLLNPRPTIIDAPPSPSVHTPSGVEHFDYHEYNAEEEDEASGVGHFTSSDHSEEYNAEEEEDASGVGKLTSSDHSEEDELLVHED